MGLSGNLEDLALSDIIQIINLSKKTGTLTLTNKAINGAIVFREGAIIQAISSLKIASISEVLIQKGMVSAEQIDEIFRLKESEFPDKTAASLLVETKLLPLELVENLARKYIEKAVSELLLWKEGSFDFALDDTTLDPSFGREIDLIKLEQGIAPQMLFVEVARKIQTQPEAADDNEDILETIPVPSEVPKQKKRIEPAPPPEKKHVLAGPPAVEKRKSVSTVQPKAKPIEPKKTEVADQAGVDKHIIFIDDEKVFLDLVSKKLKKKGFIVYSFMELERALVQLEQLVEQNTIPILISDLVIPSAHSTDGLGGIDFLDEINLSYPYIPVIILSDQHDPKIRYQAYEHGARNYLYKPDRSSIKISEIAREIDRFGDELTLCINNIFRERDRLQEMMTSINTIKGATQRTVRSRAEQKPGELLQPDPELQKMKQIFYELQNPKETSEVILLVLRLASEHLERGILFLVQKESLRGIGGFGHAMDGEAITAKIPAFRIARKGPSIFKNVLDDRKMFIGIPDHTPVNTELYTYIGRPFNEIVVAIPLLSEGRIIAIFYGDNGSRMKAIDNIVGLEIFVNQAGIALENALLQKKLKGKQP
ncbi:response regulator [bacterium]|nr:response regulator [bacterium]